MRAIQFVRYNAADWNIDPKRTGVTGNSAFERAEVLAKGGCKAARQRRP